MSARISSDSTPRMPPPSSARSLRGPLRARRSIRWVWFSAPGAMKFSFAQYDGLKKADPKMLRGLNTQWLQFSMTSRADFDPRSPDRPADIVDVGRGAGGKQPRGR